MLHTKIYLCVLVIDEPVVICDKFPLFPANILKERHLNLSENEFTLDWDPMSTFNKEMKLAEESVITATNREKVSSSFDFTFSKDIFPKEGMFTYFKVFYGYLFKKRIYLMLIFINILVFLNKD